MQLQIRNWAEYQAHSHRATSPWVKWHKAILRCEDFNALALDRRWIWPCLLLLVTDDKGTLPSEDAINRALAIGKYTPRDCKLIPPFNVEEFAPFLDVSTGVEQVLNECSTDVGPSRGRVEVEESRRDQSRSCAESATPPTAHESPEVLLIFPCKPGRRSKSREWALTRDKLAEWYRTWGKDLDLLRELRKARQWLLDHPGKQKTHEGMPGFLGNWLIRAIDHGTGTPAPSKAEVKAQVDRLRRAKAADEEQARRAYEARFRRNGDAESVGDVVAEVVGGSGDGD